MSYPERYNRMRNALVPALTKAPTDLPATTTLVDPLADHITMLDDNAV